MKRTAVGLIPVEQRILTIRGTTVMLDADLAAVFGVSTKVLNQAVKRNAGRFPTDFRFQLTKAEKKQVVTERDHLRAVKFSPVLPWAFTEHGSIMAASVLNSPRAVEMSVFVVRAFIRLREFARAHAGLAAKLNALERKIAGHDKDLQRMFAALRALVVPPTNTSGRIGFIGDRK